MDIKVLIVDDELLIRQGIKHYINWEQEGFVVIGEASNGQEAITLIEESQPQIVVTDIVMPIMDGEELTKIIKEKYPGIAVIILSSYGEFEYVRSAFQYGAVDYVLKPKIESGELLKVLKKASKQISSPIDGNVKINRQMVVNSIMEKLVYGYEVGKEVDHLYQIFPHEFYYVLGLNVEHIQPKQKNWLQKKINRNLAEFFIEKGIESCIYEYVYQPNLFIWIINSEEEVGNFTVGGIEYLAAENVELQFVCSKMFKNPLQLAVICKENIQSLVNKHFFLPQYSLLTEENIPSIEPLKSKFEFELFAKDFRRKQFTEAFQYLSNYAMLLSKQHSLSSFEYKAFLSNSIFNITIELNHLGYHFSQIDQEKYVYIQKIDAIKSAVKGLTLLQEFIEKVQSGIEKNNQNESLNIKMIMDYIHKNYEKSLSLASVAEYFHFHPSYLSNYFSTHNKEGFNEYLNKVRIEEASKLLRNSQLTISEIGATVGYSDHSYFCKVFKKITKVSPSHYRRSIQRGKHR